MTQLILGGARSGKSRLAEQRAQAWSERNGGELIYLATARAGDSEMGRRIAQHQQRRGQEWELIEEPDNLSEVVASFENEKACLLVDCLTLWISNCLHDGVWDLRRDAFLKQVARLQQDASPLELILVSNEVGSGVVPLGELSRDFVDASGWLHQALAEYCRTVTLVVAGLPLELKESFYA